MKKIFVAILMAISLAAHAQTDLDKVQMACSFLAVAGEGAALARASGVSEADARTAWFNSVDKNANGDYAVGLKRIGEREISSVYAKNITIQSEGYWEGYQVCTGALR